MDEGFCDLEGRNQQGGDGLGRFDVELGVGLGWFVDLAMAFFSFSLSFSLSLLAFWLRHL
jgi:hypothetical protein